MYWKTVVGMVQRGVTLNKVERCVLVGGVIWLGTTLNWVSCEVQVDRRRSSCNWYFCDIARNRVQIMSYNHLWIYKLSIKIEESDEQKKHSINSIIIEVNHLSSLKYA